MDMPLKPHLVERPSSYQDPCPCGSGRTYFECCWRLRELWDHSPSRLSEETIEAGRRAAVWKVGWMPVLNTFTDYFTPPWTGFAVVASGRIIYKTGRERGPIPITRRARDMGEQIAWIAYHIGAPPAVIWTRDREFADALGGFLKPRGIPVAYSSEMEDFDRATAEQFQKYVEKWKDHLYTVEARSWSGWGLPRAWLEGLFEALSRCWEMEIWSIVTKDYRLIVEEGCERWYVHTLSPPRPSLRIFTEPDDWFRLFFAEDMRFPGLHGRAYAIGFLEREDLPGPAAQEVDDLGLTVAGPEAYPWLHVVEGPGRSLSHRQSDRLLRILQALVRVCEESVEGGLEIDHRYTDEETAISFTRCLVR